MDIRNLEEFLADNRVDIAILTTPKRAVQEVAERLVKGGVMGLLNFSYAELSLPHGVAVENVHISDPMMTLSYKIKQAREGHSV